MPRSTFVLPADKRRHYSNVTETLDKIRKALLEAPEGDDLTITVDHKKK